MKTIEVLALLRSLVSTEAGLAGLPGEIVCWAHSAASPRGFAKAPIEGVSGSSRVIPAAVFTPFSVESLSATFLLAYAAG